jgi:hypothetical protein
VVVTLGNGVAQNSTEHGRGRDLRKPSTLSRHLRMTHPALAVGHTFKVNGDSGSLVYDVTPIAAAASGRRAAVSYNSDTANGNNFPRSIFSARYTADTSIRLERRRSGDDLAAWVQGIDSSAIGHPDGDARTRPPRATSLPVGDRVPSTPP